MYLLQWFGPFFSVEDLTDWENKKNKEEKTFYLYFFQGKKSCDRWKRLYCGMTFKQGSVSSRMRNHDHHIHDFEERPRDLRIWVGAIYNSNRILEQDVKNCENLLISYIMQAHQRYKNEVVNATNYKSPKNTDIHIINEWYNRNEIEYLRHAKDSVPAIIPDVISYNADSSALFCAQALKYKCDVIKRDK